MVRRARKNAEICRSAHLFDRDQERENERVIRVTATFYSLDYVWHSKCRTTKREKKNILIHQWVAWQIQSARANERRPSYRFRQSLLLLLQFSSAHGLDGHLDVRHGSTKNELEQSITYSNTCSLVFSSDRNHRMKWTFNRWVFIDQPYVILTMTWAVNLNASTCGEF